MIGASKILTVSYGTFSCTLEGFDDPFNTMRAIAEYFRDLAAEDRYFGAEPPTPDAAMLHRIAEREIQRRVEAKIEDNGVVLRAGDVEVAAPAPRSADRVVPRLSDPVILPGADSIAARLSRLRDAEAQSAPLIAAPDARVSEIADADFAGPAQPQPMEDYTEDEHADDMVIAPDTAALMPQKDEPDVAEDVGAPEAALFFDDLPTEAEQQPDQVDAEFDADTDALFADLPAADLIEQTDDAAAQAEDTIASILADLRAERVEAANLADEEPIEELDAELLQDIADETADALPEPDESVDYLIENVDQHNASADDDLQQMLGSMIDPDWDDDSETVDQTPAAVIDTDPEPPADAKEAPATTASEVATLAEDLANDPADLAPDGQAGDRTQRARARVIRIRRIEARAALAQTATEEEVVAAPEQADRPSLLSAEAEAELQRELAALEAEAAPLAVASVASESVILIAPEPVPVVAEPEVDAEPTVAEDAGEARRLQVTSPGDDAVTRLISQTNSAMEGPENKRRLAAIAHLKAAVAATFADRKANTGAPQTDKTERMDPYRDDLDRVVRPRRPALVGSQAGDQTAETSATERPAPLPHERPAPLVLVSEQRIDRPVAGAPVAPAQAPVMPVRPRRVTSAMLAAAPIADAIAAQDDDADETENTLQPEDVDNIFADAEGQAFGEFAERLGATTMPELLEAAGAYCALVLGRGQFTRPLLLQQISRLPDAAEISREDCLRGFGTLLRDGRITKIKRGQFKLSDHSRLLSDAKKLEG